jgi:cystathionine beta-lyase/cystathionine gamma-synthase
MTVCPHYRSVPRFSRFAIALDDVDDLIADLNQALAAIKDG